MLLSKIPTLPVSGLNLPPALAELERLGTNAYWTWQTSVQELFQTLNPEGWAAKWGPIQILKEHRDLEKFANNKDFVAKVKAEAEKLDAYLNSEDNSWYGRRKNTEGFENNPIAYFCAEYALFEGFNQYAGGLGILAGDHCKEASDLALPFVAIGLFYHRGFFHQMVDWDGRQEHFYPHKDAEHCSLVRVAKPGTQEQLVIDLEFEGRTVKAAVWLQAVGRMPLILLSTALPENNVDDQYITSQLYCNSRSMRLHQETILGVGGVRALTALGIEPSVWHMNEGHSAFLILERLRVLSNQGHYFKDARSAVSKNSLITIHTPVPEGNERFDVALAKRLIDPIVKGTNLKSSELTKLALGADGDPNVFDMTAFALRHSNAANGVSLLHGETADKTWRKIFGKKVIGVTNGVHMPTWLGSEMRAVLENAGANFSRDTHVDLDITEDRPNWAGAMKINDKELWEAHLMQKQQMVEFLRERLRTQHARHGDGPERIKHIADALDPEAFIIGFGRRFAPYKRAYLLFSDEKRVDKFLSQKGRPIQMVFAGKAHPIDRAGQDIVQRVYQLSQDPRYFGKVFHIEDYDMEVGRAIVKGSDVWLNNPRRPLEASGTSGMKAAANGIPNASILDGWWDEGYDKDNLNGWAIGKRKVPSTIAEQDEVDAAALYKVLEKEVVPMFFDRNKSGLPKEWIEVMKRAISSSVYSFSTARMIRDYVDLMYAEAATNK